MRHIRDHAAHLVRMVGLLDAFFLQHDFLELAVGEEDDDIAVLDVADGEYR